MFKARINAKPSIIGKGQPVVEEKEEKEEKPKVKKRKRV